jgi:uncharacterized protein (TIGR02246 family)
MLRKAGTLLLVPLLAVACGGEQAGEEATMPAGMGLPDEDVRAILAMDRTFQDAVAAGDWEALRGLYAPDAVQLPPGHQKVEGAEAIIAYFAESNPDGGLDGFHTATDVIHGDATIGYHRGTWTAGSGDAAMAGKYLWVLRRTPDGEWRIVVDMFNLDG